jgi:hypothetical protein
VIVAEIAVDKLLAAIIALYVATILVLTATRPLATIISIAALVFVMLESSTSAFLRFNIKPTRHLALIISGLRLSYLSGLRSIILIVITTCLMSTLSEGYNLSLYSLY